MKKNNPRRIKIMTKKYELTEESLRINGRDLYRIRALKDFNDVKKGDLGGFVESEENLSHEGNSWIYDNARVFENAMVIDNAQVHDHATMHGHAQAFDNAKISGFSAIYNNATISGNSCVAADAQVSGEAWVSGDACVSGEAWVSGDACVSGEAWVSADTHINDKAWIKSNNDFISVIGFGSKNRTITFYLTKDRTIRVTCEDFKGTLNEFREKVKEKYSEAITYGKGYLTIIDLMEGKFKNWI